MTKLWLTITLIFLATSSFTQDNDKVLLTIDNEPVYASEFVRILTKNLQNQNEKPDIEESLELFINFKLKVKAAEDEAIDTTQVFIRDLGQYRSQLAQPYLLDQKVTKELLDEAWERSQLEVRTSHILVGLKSDAPPSDTLLAFQRAAKFRDRLLAGEDFAELAREVSDDPSAKENGGDLGYYTVFDLVYPFENAAYKTPVGKISDPVRTDFGYHIIKVTDKIPTRGQIKVSVILKSRIYGMTQEEEARMKTEIDEIYAKLQAGEDFAELAREYSDDKNTGSRGGQVPWFGVGSKAKDFEEAAFGIKNIGDYTEPVLTQMGWYIIKLDDRKIPSKEEMTPVLERRISRDGSRSAKSRKVITDRLKAEYNFKVNKKNYEEFYRLVDPSIFEERWDPNPALQKNGVLYTLDGKDYPQSDFARFLALNMRETNEVPISEFVDKQFDDFIQNSILKYEESQLERKYPEFRDLYKEFRDGNLLFEITDKKVWSKASADTIGLKAFYQKNKNNYMWGERLNGTIIYCKSDNNVDEMAREMQSAVNKYSKSDTDQPAVEEILNEIALKYSGSFELSSGPFSKGENAIAEQVKWKKGVSDIIAEKDARIFVWIRSILEPMPKAFSETRGQVTADYQEYLDKEWIRELRNKYSVEIDENVLKGIKI